MTFLDATLPELTAASGEDWSGNAALKSFLNGFDVGSVTKWLGSDEHFSTNEREPRYFRYLVLTCVIAVNDIHGVDSGTNNFRIRLGQTLGMSELQTVKGVNPLWKALSEWSRKQRATGRAIREVVLPDPGNMNLIGFAVRMAFPSWRDRTQFTAVLKGIPETIRSSPARLVKELTRTHRTLDVPTAIGSAMDDFGKRLKSGETMLAGHRFWSLVKSIEAAIALEEGHPSRAPIHIELRFGGYDQDEPEFRLFERKIRADDRQVSGDGGSWQDVISNIPSDRSSGVAQALQRGYAVFRRSAGYWICDEDGIDQNDMCMVVSAKGSPARRWNLGTQWKEIGGHWEISGFVDGSDVVRLVGGQNTSIRELDRPTLIGGVRLKRGVYLGRPGFLPRVDQFGTAKISANRLVGSEGRISIGDNGAIETETPVDGIWRISITQRSDAIEIPLSLERDAAEPAVFAKTPPAPKWRPEEELRSLIPSQVVQLPANSLLDPAEATAADGLCEAVFSRAGSGWRDGDLVTLFGDALPKSTMAWDVLRCFQEAGWLDAYSSTAWRARTWRCRLPSFVRLSISDAVVDGALGNVMLARLEDSARRLRVTVRRIGGLSLYSPPTIHITGPDLDRLVESIGWPIFPLEGLPSSVPSNQWIEDERTPDGRVRAGFWSHSVGLFLDYDRDPTSVSVERWIRERSDEADLYVLRNGNRIVGKTQSRVSAILAGHRLNSVPLFTVRGDTVVRTRKSGYLPLPIARQMRIRSLRSSGPIECDASKSAYAYNLDLQTQIWLRRFMAGGLEFKAPPGAGPTAKSVEWRHRGGRRPPWIDLYSGHNT